MDNQKRLFVSVVITVYNDSERLKKCLESLENQTYPKDLYEVIVVDNCSSQDIESIAKQFCHTVFVREDYPTTSAARNKGISFAKGAILAFTDADCIPALNWIEKGAGYLSTIINFGMVGGRVDIFFKSPDNPTAAELFEKVTAFRQRWYLENLHFVAAANLFIWRAVIDKVGPFDSTLKSGGDVELGKRIFQAGFKQVYADDLVVLHPARYSLEEVIRKHKRIIGGLYDIQKKSGGYPLKKFIIDIKNDWPLFRDFSSVFADERLKGLKQKAKVIFVMTMVKFVRIQERIRLRLGGISKRY